jgi:flagellar motor component MotA
MKSLAEKLNLSPDQHEQLASLPAETIANLEALPPCVQELIGELWRASKEVRETNFRGTPDDRFKAWRDLRIVQWKKAILDGRNPHHFDEMLPQKDIESFKEQLREERINFKEWGEIDPTTGKRDVVEWLFLTPRPRRK